MEHVEFEASLADKYSKKLAELETKVEQFRDILGDTNRSWMIEKSSLEVQFEQIFGKRKKKVS
ncbi:MAG: hypothetical protein ABSB71_07885 [Candidatus Bathyarchaeia archaeon]|jgi:hypothetical protein